MVSTDLSSQNAVTDETKRLGRHEGEPSETSAPVSCFIPDGSWNNPLSSFVTSVASVCCSAVETVCYPGLGAGPLPAQTVPAAAAVSWERGASGPGAGRRSGP